MITYTIVSQTGIFGNYYRLNVVVIDKSNI